MIEAIVAREKILSSFEEERKRKKSSSELVSNRIERLLLDSPLSIEDNSIVVVVVVHTIRGGKQKGLRVAI